MIILEYSFNTYVSDSEDRLENGLSANHVKLAPAIQV